LHSFGWFQEPTHIGSLSSPMLRKMRSRLWGAESIVVLSSSVVSVPSIRSEGKICVEVSNIQFFLAAEW
jgi:hypothetical protein